ncbi:MAG: hypothetical protein CO042_02040, partial [Parcubacteria group bacterium CG_4_9_14_0_2_um_filter_41_8]
FFRIYWKWNKAQKIQRIFYALIVTIGYVLTVTLLAWILSTHDLFSISKFINNKEAVNFPSVLLTLVGMLGTIMAIVFSLSVLAVQKSSDSYSSRYIRNFVWDWREYSIYSIFSLSIISLLYLVFRPDFYSSNLLFSAYFSLLVISFLLFLIFAQYKTVTKKIDPYYVLKMLAKESSQQIKNVEAYSQQLSTINAFTKDGGLAVKSLIFQYKLSPLKSRIKDIYSISMRLSDKGDIETVNYGFNAIKGILLIFFQGIKDSTFIYLSEHGVLSFDAKENNFLAHLYEKFEAAGVKFMEIKAWDNARTIVDIYYESCMATAEIRPALNTSLALTGENPIFNLTRGYFAKFIDVAMAKKDLETVFKAMQMIEPIMRATIDNRLNIQCSLLIETVRKLLIYDISNGISLLPEYCVDIYLKSIKHIILSENSYGYYFLQSIFNELKQVFVILPFNSQVKFEVELQTMILEIDPNAHANYADNIVSFFDQLHEFFLDQFRSQKITSNFWLIAQLLEYSVHTIQKLESHQSFESHKRSLQNLINDFIQLPVTFYGFIKGESLSSDKLPSKLVTVVYKPVQNCFKDNAELLRISTENIVKILTNILSDNNARAPFFGENNYLTLGDRPVASKTGTTNDYRDAWLMGYTPSLATGVWVGNNDFSAMKRGAGGSTVAGPIWNRFMRN